MLSFSSLKTPILLIKREIVPRNWVRTILTGSPRFCENVEEKNLAENDIDVENKKRQPLSECLEYMESDAYKITYKDKPVWAVYVRNYKGSYPPETRESCLTSSGKVITGSPCPICRDEYLLPHYKNVKLLEQFISPHGGNIIETKKTGVCQKQHVELLVAIKKAQNYGLLKFPIPHRHYDYSLYNKK